MRKLDGKQDDSLDSGKGRSLSQNMAWYWFWLPLVMLFLVSVTMIFIWSRSDHSSLMSQIRDEELHNLDVYTAKIADSLDHVLFDLKWLPRQNELLEWLNSGNPEDLEKVVKEYLALSASRPFYDHLRLLDVSGQEIFRVGIVDGTPAVVPEGELQNKASRYYFKESYMLPKDGVYISPLDLNIEHGQVERPYKPMIRFVVPVYDDQDRWRGSLVLNYLGDSLIKLLKRTSETAVGSLMLLNSAGYWLISENPADEWGFMLEEREGRRFLIDFPEAWSILNQSLTGQFQNNDGLFTFASIRLSEQWMNNLMQTKEGMAGFSTVVAPGTDWKVISHVSSQTLSERFSRLERNKWMFLLLAIFCSVLVSSFSYRERRKHREHQNELEKMAFFDDLTGLTSRALFIDRLRELIQKARRDKDLFALMVIDLDGFKKINDSFGHGGGDQLLCLVADRLLQSVRSTDTVARTGGDEFSIILPKIEHAQDADFVAQKILDALQATFRIKNQGCHIGASIGISISSNQEQDADTLWKQADLAMYKAKQSGKNRYCCFASVESFLGTQAV